jgi:SPP1 gp7 family putative phage head morphogenesis protein
LFEELVAVRETLFADKTKRYKTAENLLTRQVTQAAINLEDAIAMVVFKALGVEKVMWVAEDDSKTCKDCKALDGKIFPLEDAPPKLHPNCRCYYIPTK